MLHLLTIDLIIIIAIIYVVLTNVTYTSHGLSRLMDLSVSIYYTDYIKISEKYVL